MPLLILLIFAVVVGYWLSRSRYHTTIDKATLAAVRQPKIGGTELPTALKAADRS